MCVQAVLLEYVKENLGFSKGRPVMACLVYKAMVHWSMIEVERLNTFDAVMMIQDEACKQANPDIHCYWLSNTVHMLFLVSVTVPGQGVSLCVSAVLPQHARRQTPTCNAPGGRTLCTCSA